MQKARRHYIVNYIAPTACRRTVSGSFHSPSWGSFHLSLTVLVHYRSLGSIQPCQMVLARSDRISPVPPYSSSSIQPFHVQDFHPLRLSFPEYSIKIIQTLWARPRSLATTCGISIDLLSYGYLDVSVPRVRLRLVFNQSGCPIRTFTDHSSFAAPRNFSQLTTSFVASESLGIRHTPLFASFFLIDLNNDIKINQAFFES